MKETPIILSTDMVKAILDGRKTQTRRVVKPQPHWSWDEKPYPINTNAGTITWCFHGHDGWGYKKCPYGQVGDRLWVRETWATLGSLDSLSPCELNPETSPIFYKTDGKSFPMYADKGKWRPSIHIMKWACRIWLEITEVRVERLQEISAYDAVREGCTPYFKGNSFYPPRGIFKELWNSLNAKRGYGWDTNPWVWVLSFRRIE